jgi:hypothetical protein
MELRQEHVVVETDRYRIEGSLTLSTEGARSRLSDYLNQRDREFFVLRDASVDPLEPSDGERRQEPVVLVARRYIRMVTPAGGEDAAA